MHCTLSHGAQLIEKWRPNDTGWPCSSGADSSEAVEGKKKNKNWRRRAGRQRRRRQIDIVQCSKGVRGWNISVELRRTFECLSGHQAHYTDCSLANLFSLRERKRSSNIIESIDMQRESSFFYSRICQNLPIFYCYSFGFVCFLFLSLQCIQIKSSNNMAY